MRRRLAQQQRELRLLVRVATLRALAPRAEQRAAQRPRPAWLGVGLGLGLGVGVGVGLGVVRVLGFGFGLG